MLKITQAATPEQLSDVRSLLREYTDWVFSMTEASRDAPTFQGFEQELAALPGPYAPPQGRLILATQNGDPAGCIALKRRDEERGELKRLYVRPAFRGNSIGARLVEAVIAEARDCGYRKLVLDSHISMTSAHDIYRKAGFRDVDPPVGFPEIYRPVVVFMDLNLGPSA
jgi:GNAT superfamily N-acetyltransferase